MWYAVRREDVVVGADLSRFVANFHHAFSFYDVIKFII